MIYKKIKILFALIVLVCLGFMLFYGNTFVKVAVAVDEIKTDQPCWDRGGECMHGYPNTGVSCKLSNGRPGTIIGRLCLSRYTDMQYRCCVPDDESRTDQPCWDRGGECMHGYPVTGVSCKLSDGRSGTIIGRLCLSRYTDMQYRCCVPDEESVAEEVIQTDRGCDEIGGTCQWIARGSTGTTCTLSNGELGCYLAAVCRTPDNLYSEDMEYRCCAKTDWCDDKVDYSKWGDILFNGDCPFSVEGPAETRTHCSQGPYNSYSHSNYNAVDTPHIDYVDFGTEYFTTPNDGYLIKAIDVSYSQTGQRCGGVLEFQTGEIIYEIRHAFIFGSLLEGYDETGYPKGEPRFIKKGTVIAKIALPSDDSIIEFKRDKPTCATGSHFHVKVTGTEKCADCHFVDDLGCNLRYPGLECGRCNRTSVLLEPCKCKVDCIGQCCPKGGCCVPVSSSIQYPCQVDPSHRRCDFD